MIGTQVLPGFKYTVGVAYIAVPSDLERATYIKDCYTNLQVSIITEDGGFHNRVPISQELLNFVVFPQTAKTLGTPIVYVTDDTYQQPVVVTRLQRREELGDGKENQFKFSRKLNGRMVEINGSTQDGVLNLIVDGADIPGAINLIVTNKAKTCTLNVKVNGDINVDATGTTTFTQEKGFVATTADSDADESASFKQSTTENKFYNKKLIVNDGTDPLARGNELKAFLSKFIDKVAAITTSTAIGVQPILNKVEVLKLKDDLDTILSTVVFTDK